MPILQLPTSHRAITEAVTGIMVFPTSLSKRRELKRAFALDWARPLVDAKVLEIRDTALYEENLKNHVPAAALVNRAAEEMGSDPTLAGAMLLLTLGTDRRVASLNLSNLALDLAYKNKRPTSKRKLEYIWQEYQSVAHFWAAHQIWITPGAMPNVTILEGFPCHPSQVMLFLAMAEYLRRKGENFRAPRSPNNAFLLDKNRTWRIAPASRVGRMTDKDFRFDSMYKFLLPILNERKRYGAK